MKKYLISSLVFVLALAVSGCSLAPGQNTTTGSGSSGKTYTFSQSVWKSTDGGKTWEAKNKTETRPRVSDVNVLTSSFDPSDSNSVYLGLKSGGLIFSTDAGETWKFSEIFTSEKVYGLVFDPTNPRVIYASAVFEGRGKMFKSSDKGETWKEIYTSAANGPLVVSLVIDKRNPQTLYASTSDNQVVKSVDGGNSWKNIFQTSQPVAEVAMDSADGNLIYLLATDGTLFRSTDGGGSFSDIREKLSQGFSISGGGYSVLETDPSVSGVVYLAGQEGIVKSIDGGNTWKKIVALSDPSSFPVTAMGINPKNPNEIIYGAGQATFKSVDGGVNWSTSQFDIKKKIRFIKYDPSSSAVVYLGLNQ